MIAMAVIVLHVLSHTLFFFFFFFFFQSFDSLWFQNNSITNNIDFPSGKIVYPPIHVEQWGGAPCFQIY